MSKHKCAECGKRRANRDMTRVVSEKHPAGAMVCIDDRACWSKAKGKVLKGAGR